MAYEPYRGDGTHTPYIRLVLVTETEGIKKDFKDYHKVVAFGPIASHCHAKQGDYLEVNGRLSYAKRTQKVGGKIMEAAVYATDIKTIG